MEEILSPLIQFLIEWVLKQLIIDDLFEEFVFKQIKRFVQENDHEYRKKIEDDYLVKILSDADADQQNKGVSNDQETNLEENKE